MSWLLWSLLGLLLVLAPIKPAAAHAVLELAVPADRSVLQMPPRQFSLRFDETVVVTDLRLLDSAG
ncbi:MAG: copper resistance protein CopC, partial [Dongiaceae bacterium]